MQRRNVSYLGRRFFASFIDYALISIFFLVYAKFFGHLNEDGELSLSGFQNFVPLFFWFIYLVVVESLASATLGHFVMGVKVIGINEKRITFNQSLKRHLLDFIDFSFAGIVAIISISNSKEHQRLGDLWAKTIVVKDS